MRKITRSKAMVLIASLGVVMAVPAAGRAQSTDYPNQRISIVVGFAVGGFAERTFSVKTFGDTPVAR